MSISAGYAIKKDIRNNPIVRHTDARQKGEFLRILLLVGLTIGTLLISVKWHMGMQLARIRLEQKRETLAADRETNRVLRLNLETTRSPKAIELAARRLGLRSPTLAEVVVIERAYESSPAGSIVARLE